MNINEQQQQAAAAAATAEFERQQQQQRGSAATASIEFNIFQRIVATRVIYRDLVRRAQLEKAYVLSHM